MRKLACALALLAFGPAACRSGAPVRHGPNIVFVSVDTLRSDHIGAYGAAQAQTPTLDALARRGVRFAKVIASAPLTLPSHATMFTGLYPPHHGVRHNGIFKLDPSIPTLAERLRTAGYATAAIVASEVLDSRYGLDRGFDTYDDELGQSRAAPVGYYRERGAAEVTQRAVAFLAANPARPFFLFVHYFDPHADYWPPEPYASSFKDNPYDGEIAYVDASLGELLGALRTGGWENDTVVIVTADHGEALGEHGETTHGYLIYDCVLSVPLLMAGPGIPAGRTIPGIATLADVAPTVLKLAGLPPFEIADGRDLSRAWEGMAAPADGMQAAGSSTAAREVYAENLATRYDHGWSPLHAIRGDLFFYVRAPQPELYDVRADPGERNNLLESEPGAWNDTVRAAEKNLQAILAGERREERITIDAKTRERLNALGYKLQEHPAEYSGMDPKDGIPWVDPFLEALQAFARGEYDAARPILEHMVEAVPRSPNAHALLAHVLLAQMHSREALSHAEAAVRLDPANVKWREVRAEALEAVGRDREAAAEYEMISQLGGEQWKVRLKKLERLARTADRAALEREANCFAEDFSTDADAQSALCNFWFGRKQIDRAIAAGERAVRLAPGSTDAHMFLAVALTRARRDEEATAHLRLAASAARKPALRNQLAIAYAERGDLERAGAIWEEIRRSYPDSETVRENLLILDIHRTAHAATRAATPSTPPGAQGGPTPRAP